MISIQQVQALHQSKTKDWHEELSREKESLPWKFIEENHFWNFSLWHEEDIARIKDIDPVRIMAAKQNIDKYNQLRNNAMEKIDEWILNYTSNQQTKLLGDSKLHSETPGMMIDRLSIMALKSYHMEEEVYREGADDDHKAKCQQKLAILEEQIKDLSDCLDEVLLKISIGKLKFKVYRQLKMYNDPSLNPQLYNKKNAKTY